MTSEIIHPARNDIFLSPIFLLETGSTENGRQKNIPTCAIDCATPCQQPDREACHYPNFLRSLNPPSGSWGMVQVQPTDGSAFPNPPSGSWGMVQVQPSVFAYRGLDRSRGIDDGQRACQPIIALVTAQSAVQVEPETSPSFRWGDSGNRPLFVVGFESSPSSAGGFRRNDEETCLIYSRSLSHFFIKAVVNWPRVPA